METTQQVIDIGLVNTLELLEATRLVRNQVFIQEQEIDASLEFDNNDIQSKEEILNQQPQQHLSTLRYYYIKCENDGVCGTCRARKTTENTWKIERVATLKSHRGKGLGQRLISFVIGDLSDHNNNNTNDTTQSIYIHAQLSAYPFWSRGNFNNGQFVKVGEDFVEANIPHCKMMYHPSTTTK